MSKIATINNNMVVFLNNITKISWHNNNCNEQLYSILKELFYWAKQNTDTINLNIQNKTQSDRCK